MKERLISALGQLHIGKKKDFKKANPSPQSSLETGVENVMHQLHETSDVWE